MKYYVLWSYNIDNLERQFSVLNAEDTVVVINTLHEDEKVKGIDWCKRNCVTYHVTESDGTPATGKNSVLKIFLESGDEYMVHIDGDDYLTPHGVMLYKELARHTDPPDMVVLYRQQGIDPEGNICYPFDKRDVITPRDLLIDFFMKNKNYRLDQTTATTWADDRLEFDDWMHRKMECSEFMCRMVFHSRKVAELMYYNNVIEVGEDTLQFLQLKRLALKGSLKVMRRKERDNPTYMYDQSQKNKSFMRNKYAYNWSWCKPLLEELKKVGDLEDYVQLKEFRDEQWVNIQTNLQR